jgi:deazaflavin-dependent oxidoreductase (nitroreductase family)
MKEFNRSLIAEFRSSGGHVSGVLADSPMLLLTTTGAHSGRPHTTPLGYVTDRTPDRLVVFASNMGAARHPAWFHNLRADPQAEVEVGERRFPVTATIATGADYDRLYRLFTESMPGTGDHQERAGQRQIPMVLLEPARPE